MEIQLFEVCMMEKEDKKMKELFSYLIPLASIFISFLLGNAQNNKKHKIEIYKERYTKLYCPFITKLYASFAWENKFSKMSFRARSAYFDMLMKNLEYLDKNSLSLIPDFYLAFLNMLEFEDGNLSDPDIPETLDKIFNQLVKCLLTESLELSSKLYLPPIGSTVLAKFSQSQGTPL